MSNQQTITAKNESQVNAYTDFWRWFQQEEKKFFTVVKNKGDVAEEFFSKLSEKLTPLNDGFFYLTGMCDTETVELIITAEGAIKNIVFAEEFIKSAPSTEGWKFIALKPALDISKLNIQMNDCSFNADNISFYANEFEGYPDEIDITIVHHDFTEENKQVIVNGTYIFLDNYLGELEFATTIDNLTVVGKNEAEKELIPIAKLKDYLVWRQKEFVEKYEAVQYSTATDNYAAFQAELENGNPLIAIINTNLLDWDGKASHPWIAQVDIKYEGENGMPDKAGFELLDEIEDKILDELKDANGNLYIGRQTANNVREIYFACKDFRAPSKVLQQIQQEYTSSMEISFDIYKDKYWQSFNRFNNNG